MGCNQYACFQDDELVLDVLISHPEYARPDELRDKKVVEILNLKNKDIKLAYA
jgi:tRNA G37 N-methylase TrmD